MASQRYTRKPGRRGPGLYMAVGAAALLALAAALFFYLGGGEPVTGSGKTNPTGHPAFSDEAHPNLTDLGDSVAIRYPAAMFAETELTQEFIEVNNYLSAERAEDGSVTVTMSKERQQQFLDAYKGDLDYNIDYFKSEIAYLRDIWYAPDYRSMEIYVDGGTDTEILKELPYFFSTTFIEYQRTLGWETGVAISVIDDETRQTVMTLEFPEDGE